MKSKRGSKNVCFIAVNDGSCLKSIQIVIESRLLEQKVIKEISTGASIKVKGILVASKGGEQAFEVKAKEINLLGGANPEEYPLQPKKHSLDFLREKAHLRFRTNTFSAVFRIRHTLTYATVSYTHLTLPTKRIV